MSPRKKLACCVGLVGLMAINGCQLFYYLTNPEKTESVEAEYGKIGNRTVAVVSRAPVSMLDEYPYAQRRVEKSVTHRLVKHLPEATLVSAKKVQKARQRSLIDWEAAVPSELCEELECELVLIIDLHEFTSRASNTPQLRKARIEADLALYEIEGIDPVYSDSVKITYPPGAVHGAQDLTEEDLVHESVEHFSEVTSRKFHAYERKLQDGPGW